MKNAHCDAYSDTWSLLNFSKILLIVVIIFIISFQICFKQKYTIISNKYYIIQIIYYYIQFITFYILLNYNGDLIIAVHTKYEILKTKRNLLKEEKKHYYYKT